MRYALPQPVTRHAAEDDALVVAGSVPVRRGIAVVAVVGGALSVAGIAVDAPAPAPHDPGDVDASSIGLAANSKPVDKHNDLVGDELVFDGGALSRSVKRAGDEGRRLAAEDQASRNAAESAAADSADSTAAGQLPTGTASMPAQLIDTNDWYLTLPTGKQGSPDLVNGSKLASYHSKFFDLNQQRNGIVFSAGTDGVTTKNSHYPRSELREMDGSQKASWSNKDGTHAIDVREAFTQLPNAKPEVVGVQIHDDKDDVLQIRLEGKTLKVTYANGKNEAVLDPNYQLGTPFDTKIVAADGKIDVSYNGQKNVELPVSGSGWYWKVGAYVQSNGSHGDGASSSGAVTVYRADVQHGGAAESSSPA